MGVVVAFDYPTWVALFPEFAAVTAPVAQSYFTFATGVHANDGGGPIPDAATQSLLLNLLTAHFAARYAPPATGGSASPLVGRIASATEGSVTVSAEMPNQPRSAAWFQQSKYGADYWAMTAQYRTARYKAARPYLVDPLFYQR